MLRSLPFALAGFLTALGAGSLAAQSCPDPATIRGSLTGPMADVRYLADDALEGRGTGSPGERCAGHYLAARLQTLGLEPAAADGGFFQTFPVRVGARLTAPGSLAISGQPPLEGKAWRPYGFAASGRVSAPLVHGGTGVPEHGTGAAASLPGLEGRIAVIEAETPGAGGLYSDPHFKASVAAGRGALAAVILLPEGRSLPDLAGELRPDVGIPVVAVAAGEAEGIREAARRGMEGSLEVQVEPATAEARNVVALLPGGDPALRDEVLVVGAHYDHLGWGGAGSLDAGGRAIHNGADDNASGTAAVLAVAESLATGPGRPARSVLFILFSGEERGLLGSNHYVERPLLPLERTVAMLNMDMVGRLRDETLTVHGVATADEWTDLVEAANAGLDAPLRLALLPDGYGPSDHAAFHGKGLPVLHFFTNTHAEYHRPVDDWDTLNGPGLERVAALVAGVARRVAGAGGTRAATLTAVTTDRAAPAAPPGAEDAPSRGYGPYLGTIPDMSGMGGDGPEGLRLNGVREGSPAEKGGLRAGDLVVEMGGKAVTDIYSYTYALRDHAPGDEVTLVVMREGERVTLTVVLGERPAGGR